MTVGYGRYTGPPPTIAFLRQENGIQGVRVYCAGLNCGRMQEISFYDLGLPEETLFPEIARRRRWVCTGCGSREVSCMPDWPDPRQREHHPAPRNPDPTP